MFRAKDAKIGAIGTQARGEPQVTQVGTPTVNTRDIFERIAFCHGTSGHLLLPFLRREDPTLKPTGVLLAEGCPPLSGELTQGGMGVFGVNRYAISVARFSCQGWDTALHYALLHNDRDASHATAAAVQACISTAGSIFAWSRSWEFYMGEVLVLAVRAAQVAAHGSASQLRAAGDALAPIVSYLRACLTSPKTSVGAVSHLLALLDTPAPATGNVEQQWAWLQQQYHNFGRKVPWRSADEALHDFNILSCLARNTDYNMGLYFGRQQTGPETLLASTALACAFPEETQTCFALPSNSKAADAGLDAPANRARILTLLGEHGRTYMRLADEALQTEGLASRREASSIRSRSAEGAPFPLVLASTKLPYPCTLAIEDEYKHCGHLTLGCDVDVAITSEEHRLVLEAWLERLGVLDLMHVLDVEEVEAYFAT